MESFSELFDYAGNRVYSFIRLMMTDVSLISLSHAFLSISADSLGSNSIRRIFPGHFFMLSCNMTNDNNASFELDW